MRAFIHFAAKAALGLAWLLGEAAVLRAQNPQLELQLTAPVPVGPTGGGAVIGSQQGGTTVFYFVIARYPTGTSPSQPIQVQSTVGPQNFNGTNFVRVTWGALPGATGYDVVRSLTAGLPQGCSACAIVTNTTATTVNDQGGGSAYTQGTPATTGSGAFYLDNGNTTLSESLPFIQARINGSGNTLRVTPLEGPYVVGDCAVFAANSRLHDSGTPCGSGGGGISSITLGCFLTGTTNPLIANGTIKAQEIEETVSTSPYTFVAADCGKLKVFTGTEGEQDATLPQAGSAGFPSGWFVDVHYLSGVNTLVITPTTSLIDGNASLTFNPGQGTRIVAGPDGNYYTIGLTSGAGGGVCPNGNAWDIQVVNPTTPSQCLGSDNLIGVPTTFDLQFPSGVSNSGVGAATYSYDSTVITAVGESALEGAPVTTTTSQDPPTVMDPNVLTFTCGPYPAGTRFNIYRTVAGAMGSVGLVSGSPVSCSAGTLSDTTGAGSTLPPLFSAANGIFTSGSINAQGRAALAGFPNIGGGGGTGAIPSTILLGVGAGTTPVDFNGRGGILNAAILDAAQIFHPLESFNTATGVNVSMSVSDGGGGFTGTNTIAGLFNTGYSNAGNITRVTGVRAQAQSAMPSPATAANLYGFDASLQTTNTGTTSTVAGFNGLAQLTASGTTSETAGVLWSTNITAGTTALNYGVDIGTPTLSGGGTVTTRNAAFRAANQTGTAGAGKDFSFYLEGGTGKLFTGATGTVGEQIQRQMGQTADLFEMLDSDGVTVLNGFDKNGNLLHGGGALTGTASINVGLIGDGTCAAQGTTITVTGAAVGNPATVAPSTNLATSVEAFAKVTSANTVTVEICNFSGAGVTPGTATYKGFVSQ